MSLADRDKALAVEAARRFAELGFAIAATAGTADALEEDGVAVKTPRGQARDEEGTTAVDLIEAGKVDLVVNSPRAAGPGPTAATSARRPASPASRASPPRRPALAAADGMADWAVHELRVRPLQEFHAGRGARADDQLELFE